MIAKKRRNYRQGGSVVLTLPEDMVKGELTTMAENRVILADSRGETPESDLLEFLEKVVEPRLWPWLSKKQAAREGMEERQESASG